jgi:hypothetical protein
LPRGISPSDRGGIFGGIDAELAIALGPQTMLVLGPLAVIPPCLTFVAATPDLLRLRVPVAPAAALPAALEVPVA